jgi:dihydroflavonol-4-reductase
MDVLVTGATGFVGSHLVASLRARGERVRALLQPDSGAAVLEAAGVEIERGDVRDPAAAARAVSGCARVFHLAALTEAKRPSAAQLEAVNAGGTANLARAAAEAGVGRFVLASSVGVYGRTTVRGAIDEDTPPRPDSAYGASKLAAERAARGASGHQGLPLVVARLTAVLGPGATSWLPFFEAIAEQRFRVLGGGANRHHAVDVSDVAEGLRLCGAVPGIEGRTYVLGGAEPVTLRELVDLIAEAVGAPPPPGAGGGSLLRTYRLANLLVWRATGRKLPRADRIDTFLGDRVFQIARAQRDLGYAPAIATRESVRRTAAWFRERGYLAEPRAPT